MHGDAFVMMGAAALLHASSTRWPVGLWLLWRWPGVVLHELAHWAMAHIVGQHVRAVSLLPRKLKSVEVGGQITTRWTLGRVSFAGSPWLALPVAMAPLALLALGAWLAHVWFMQPAGWLERAGQAYAVVTLFTAGIPSREDFSAGFWPWLWLALFALALWAAGP